MNSSARNETPPVGNVPPVLIVDQQDIIGNALYEKLKTQSLVVLVSGTSSATDENLIFISYKNRMPKIPDSLYTAIFFVWDGEKEKLDYLPEFLKKARADKCPFVFILPYQLFDEKVVAKVLDGYKNSYVLVLGDLFGRDVITHRQSIVDESIYQAKTTGGVQLISMGLKKLYPMYFADTLSLIVQTVGEKKSYGKILYLFQKAPLTQLAVLRVMQRIDPMLHIDFLPEKKHAETIPESIFTTANSEWLVTDQYVLQERLQQVYTSIDLPREQTVIASKDQKNWSVVEKVRVPKSTSVQNPFLKNVGLFFLYCILIFVFFPPLGTLLFSFIGMQELLGAKAAIEKGNITNAQQQVAISFQAFSTADFLTTFLLPEATVIGKRASAVKLADSIAAGKSLAETSHYLLEAVGGYKAVFSGKSQFPSKDFIDATNALKNAIVDYQELGENAAIPSEYIAKLKQLSLPMTYITNTATVFPQLFGTDSERTYLILLQNNMELRPGGGFIGSYGIVRINKGHIEDFSIHDVYDADGQLRGHVEPPFAIRRYLPLVHLYLRDSNFDVDFARGAPLIATLYTAETNQKIDGVIGIDLSFVKNMIGAIGPVSVPEYNETVTENNFFLLTETHAEKNFFAGSSQKKDFLRNLFMAIQNKLTTAKNIPYITLLENAARAIKEKHVLFAFEDKTLQSIFTVNNMSSSLWEGRDDMQDGMHDFAGINEANLGVNKVNYFMQRSMSYHASISDTGEFASEMTVAYKNTSPKNEWPGGDYKNYLRAILPAGVMVVQVKIDDQVQTIVPAVTDPLIYERKGFQPPAGLEVEHYDEAGKTIYGFLVNIPSGKSKVVKILYAFPKKIDLSKPILRYNLTFFKQPGSEGDPFAFSLDYPNSLRVINATAGLNNASSSLSYINYLNTDQHFQVDFAKQ